MITDSDLRALETALFVINKLYRNQDRQLVLAKLYLMGNPETLSLTLEQVIRLLSTTASPISEHSYTLQVPHTSRK